MNLTRKGVARARALTARTAVIAVALLAGAACTPQQTATGNPPAPQDRAHVLSALRAVDPCTLYGADARVGDDPITVQGMTSPLACDARVQVAAGPADISLSVNIDSPEGNSRTPGIEHRTIDGVEVTVASPEEPRPSEPKLVKTSCHFLAHYPDRSVVGAIVSAAPEVDTCTIAEAVIRRAIDAFRRPPPPDPNTPGRTVLTGADPCASVHRLEATHTVAIDLDNSTVSSCFVTLDGSPSIDVSFGNLDPAMVAYLPAQPDVDGHRVVGDDGLIHVVVGKETTVGDDHFVPAVDISTDLPPADPRLRALIDAIAAQY